jgi:DNA-binding MarR family transcriptional regulator
MKHTHKGGLLTEAFLETFKLNGLLVASGDQLIKELGVTSARWKILGALSYSDNAMTVPDIARTMGQTRQAVQRLVNEMIKDQLLETLDNPKHQRAKLLRLTDKGKNTFNKVMEKQIPWVNAIAQDIQEKDLNSVVATLKYLNNYLGT